MISTNLDYEYVFNTLVTELMKYVKENKLHGAVLGVSGGIDSTVVAAIGNEAQKRLHKEGYDFKLLGVTMPTNTTFGEEYDAANAVIQAFFNKSTTFRIDKLSESFFLEIWNRYFDGEDIWGENSCDEKKALRKGNIKSRIRMILLYDAAKAINGIVLGTDNFTEYLLGFSTIGGDGLFDYCPIQYMWKTEVFGLAKYLRKKYSNMNGYNEKKMFRAIDMSLRLVPMDGLGISSNDMDQIGAKDYYEVDDILYEYMYKKLDKIETLKDHQKEFLPVIDGIPQETVEKVINRVKSSQYKMNHPVRVARYKYEKNN